MITERRPELPPPQAARYIAVCALVAVALSGCGVVGRTSVKTVQMAIQGKPDVQPTASEIAGSRYPQIKVTGPNGGALLVLGNIDAGRQAWYSSERSIVFLQDGIVVGTHGGTPELRRASIEGDNPFRDLRDVRDGATVIRSYDVMPGYRFGMTVTGTIRHIGTEEVEILGKVFALLHYTEELRGHGWKRRNEYWVDADSGFIRKSRQAIGPETSLEITQLKPYAPDLKPR